MTAARSARSSRPHPPSRRAIAIGASAGGIEALKQVVSRLPRDLKAPVFVVLHVSPSAPSILPAILRQAGPLPAKHAVDGEPIEPARIYIAPPDHHLLIENGHVAVKRGPKENRFRPSIDALFRSAAYTHGSGAIGVVLSGSLNDGTSGLWTIKRFGGTAIVQTPEEAQYQSMPLSVLEHLEPDYTMSTTEIGPLLGRLVETERAPAAVDDEIASRTAKEIEIAAGARALREGIMKLGTLSPFTCPECHGVLMRIDEDRIARFRCHTGHAYSESALLDSIMGSTGDLLWQVQRSLEEAVLLLRAMGRELEQTGDTAKAAPLFAKAEELERRSAAFHEAALDNESLSGENLLSGLFEPVGPEGVTDRH